MRLPYPVSVIPRPGESEDDHRGGGASGSWVKGSEGTLTTALTDAVTSVSFSQAEPRVVFVRREGLEPSSPEGQRGLSPPCMPIPAPPQGCGRHATNWLEAALHPLGRSARVSWRCRSYTSPP